MKTVEVNNSVWTEDRILNIIMSNDDQLIKAMLKIYDYQTASEQRVGATTEHNGVGFSGCDGDIMSSFCENYLKYHKLTQKQLELARKKMKKYVKQLLKVIASENHTEIVTVRKPRR